MILCTLTIENETVRISNEELALENYWEAWLLEIDNISYRMDKEYGGNRIMDWGSVKISHKLFENLNYMWPPPMSLGVKVENTNSTEAAAWTMVENATLHYSDMDDEGAFYDVYLDETDGTMLLEKASELDGACVSDYYGNDVVVPRAVGTVEYQIPLKLEDYVTQVGDPGYPGTYPCYHTGYMQGALDTDWHIFDNNSDVGSNATLGGASTSGTNTFYLNYLAHGEVTISGNGTFDAGESIGVSLDALFTARGISTTILDAYARSGDAKIGDWASSQMLVLDYVSDLCASHAHIFSIISASAGSLMAYVVKLEHFYSPVSLAYQGTKMLPVNYELSDGPTGVARAGWVRRSPVVEGGRTFVKEFQKETERSNSVFWHGETTGTATNKLVSDVSNCTWFNHHPGSVISPMVGNIGSDMMRPGMFVRNTTENTGTAVTAYDSYVQLSIADNIFASGQGFEVGYKFKHGKDLSIEAFSIDFDTIEENLMYIINFLHTRQFDLVVPLADAWAFSTFGVNGRFAIEEKRFKRPIYLNHNKIVGITYDFENEKAIYRLSGVCYEENPLT